MKLNLKSGVLGVIILAVAPQSGWAQKSGKAQTLSLPIRHGYYTSGNESCAEATNTSDGMYFRGRAFEWNEMVHKFVRVARLPTGEYMVTTRAQGEGGILNRKSKIRIVNPTTYIETFVADSETVTVKHRFCYAKPPQGWNW